MALVDLRNLASCRKDFTLYISFCETLEKKYGGVSFNLQKEYAGQHQIDKVSFQIIPDSFKEPFLPVRLTGDGNCLFNSASIAICGDQRLAVELRLRTSIELAIHCDYYRNHPVLRGAKTNLILKKVASAFSLWNRSLILLVSTPSQKENCLKRVSKQHF